MEKILSLFYCFLVLGLCIANQITGILLIRERVLKIPSISNVQLSQGYLFIVLLIVSMIEPPMIKLIKQILGDKA